MITETRSGLTQVNLLPAEERDRQKTRRTVWLVALAGIFVVGVLALVYVQQAGKISDIDKRIQAQQTTNATLQAQQAKLQPFQQMKDDLTARQGLLQTALAGDVSWSHVMQNLSAVVPPKVWISTMAGSTSSGQATTTAPAVPTTAPVDSGIVGSLTFAGTAMDTDDLSQWLTDVVRVRGWVNAWLSTAQKTNIGSTLVWQFSSTVDLSKDAISKRGGGSE